MTEEEYKDETWLREQYVEKEVTTNEMAEKAGCSSPTILRWMDNYGIERRGSNYYRKKKPPKLEHKPTGHERVRARVNGTRPTVGIHQLTAIAHGADPHDLFCGRYEVHHKNGIPWDNRPENLESLHISEHRRKHAPECFNNVESVDGGSA